VKVDIRIICATNRDLKRLVAEGRFREDLFYRINTFTIEMPPLRERHEDIAPLASYFLRRYALESRKNVMGFSPEAEALLLDYTWPGNVRELKNVIERAVILCPGSEIRIDDLPRELRSACEDRLKTAASAAGYLSGVEVAPGAGPVSKANPLEDAERGLIIDALEKSSGNVSAAARSLGITRNTLRYRMKKYCLDEDRPDGAAGTDQNAPGVG
jgi:DNA-binding NtrC family response regulator